MINALVKILCAYSLNTCSCTVVDIDLLLPSLSVLVRVLV